MKGKVVQWKDDRGFGFIQPDDGSDKVFFHISGVKTNARRPEVGDSVLYESTLDSQQRPKAKSVVIEGVAGSSRSTPSKYPVRAEGPKKGVIDYLAMLVILVSVAAAGFEFYRSGSIEASLIWGVPAVIAFFILNLPRKPKEKCFKCARCRAVARHDARTIRAWNNGFSQLYCRTCHLQWVTENPRGESGLRQSPGGGCLGVMVLMVVVPVLGSAAIYQWFA